MIAVIGEKPSVARDIARILGASEKQDGYLSGNGYLVTWAFGHLVGLAMPEAYGIQSFRRESLPIIPDSFQLTPRQVKAEKGYKADPGALKQLKVIKDVFDQSDKIIVATDAGREGELIFRYIYNYIGCNKPFVRLWISSLTDKSIREGLQNLKAGSLYDNLFLSAQARSEADYLIGINGTQALSVAAGQGIFSLGRVQSPTLAMICTRFLENKNFVPQKYWQLKLQAAKDNVSFAALSTDKYDKQQPAIDTLQRIKEAETVQVKTVERKEVNQEPPLLYDLTTLQKEANTKLNFSADKTLSIAQKLYEGKLISYPRTGSRYISQDVFEEIPERLVNLEQYTRFGGYAAGMKGKALNSRSVNDGKVTDHHAIIPTGQHPQNLTDMERRVFDLIARRFIAVFYPDCKFATTTVLGEVESIEFKATGKQILEPGWRIIFGIPSAQSQEEKEEKGEEENVLPAFVKGESGPHVPDLYEKWTQPPRPYTEATLLRAMETAGKLVDNDELRDALKENGIGRPSTRAAIIETLFKRNYIRKEKKNLIATPTGVELIQIIHEELLKSAELTGIWEKKLREIERRTYNAGQFLEELKQMVSEVVMSVLSDNSNRHITIQAPAPEKGSKVSAKTEAADKPKKEPKKRTPRKSAAAGKKTEQASGAVAASSTEASVQADDFVGQPCPLCGKGTVIKGKTAYGCSEWKSGCTFRKPFE